VLQHVLHFPNVTLLSAAIGGIISQVLTSNVQKLAKLGILAATVSFAAPVPDGLKPLTVYYESTNVQFVPEAAATRHSASLGPWTFGKRLHQDKPLDKRLNLYVVMPGQQYHSTVNPEYDHNLVVNTLTHEKAREWDIFWCIVLDPELGDDFRSEHDLLVATQQSFRPADLFDLEDIPARQVLRETAGIQSLADLNRYRRKDGSLPRLLILPAKLAVSATAEVADIPADGKIASQ
jgi:hypothetical protein